MQCPEDNIVQIGEVAEEGDVSRMEKVGSKELLKI
jgi:hypothetical protein